MEQKGFARMSILLAILTLGIIIVSYIVGSMKFFNKPFNLAPNPSTISSTQPRNKCISKSSLNCSNEQELSYECSQEYQVWAKENCPNWWGDEVVLCKEPRQQLCTAMCIENPPYICGSDEKNYCTTCQACSNKEVKWYVIKQTPCEEGVPF